MQREKMKQDNLELIGLELMGDNLRSKVKYCGEGVRLYPLCKMIHPETAELDDHCQLFVFVVDRKNRSFIVSGGGRCR